MSLTKQLRDNIVKREVTEADLKSAELYLLDALATAYAGANTPVGKRLLAWSAKDALNTRTRAFLMGSLVHITETDDLHRGSVTHPGCIVVPAVLAVAQQTGATGREVLVALLHGFEAMCRIGRAVGPAHYKIWHNTATCGPFGSAMGVATLLGLGSDQTVDALGNAGTQSSGLWQFLASGAMSKHLHAGRASESGLLAAELALQGFSGAPDILEGEQGMFKAMCPDAKPEHMLADDNEPWELTQTSIKPWPSCRHTHPAIDAALAIHAQLGNEVIDKVSISTYDSGKALCDRSEIKNEYQGKFSLQHCVAHALLTGHVDLNSFTADARDRTSTLCAATQVQLDETLCTAYPLAWGSIVKASLADGREICVVREHSKGDPELPLSTDEWIEKANMLLRYGGVDNTGADSIVKSVLSLHSSEKPCLLMDGFLRHVAPQV